MVRSIATPLLFLLAAMAGFLAAPGCVGNAPDSVAPSDTTDAGTPKAGERLGPCYPNKTCNDGLVCDVVNVICLLPGEPAPTNDAGASDGSADAAPTIPSCNAGSYPIGSSGVQCRGAACSTTEFCCQSNGITGCDDTAAACDPTTIWSCETSLHCASGWRCCGTLTFDQTQCSASGLESKCAATCANGQTQLCRDASECPQGMLCKAVFHARDGATDSIGVCSTAG